MPRRYVFADEAGNFHFSRNVGASKYFIVCLVTMDSCEIAHELLALRRELIWQGKPIGNYFHATEDKQEIRDAVFAVIGNHQFSVHAQVMEKSKSQPQVRQTEARFYKYGWFFLLRYVAPRIVQKDTELILTAASVGTKNKQRAFTAAVNDVAQQTIARSQWVTHFCPSSHDPCLQVADYCTWAIQKKWERGDNRSYDLIRDRISYEYDFFGRGAQHYY